MSRRHNTLNLTFIGTSHIDPEGYDSLYRHLCELKPELVLVEVSLYSVLFRRTAGALYRTVFDRNMKSLGLDPTPELMNARRFLDVPFEYLAARRYCRESGALLRLMDLSAFSFIRLLPAFRLVTAGNMRLIATLKADRAAQEKRLARKIFSGKDDFNPEMMLARLSRDRLALAREKKLASRLSRALRRYGSLHIACVSGWEHLIDDSRGRTLYSMAGAGAGRIISFLPDAAGRHQSHGEGSHGAPR